MPVPMRCSKGHQFEARSPIENTRSSMFAGNMLPVSCPKCGETVNMPDHGTDEQGNIHLM